MNSFLRSLAAGIFIISSFSAAAEEYTFTGLNYSASAGSYDGTMMLSGTIVTSSAIPANATNINILGLIDTFSFSDGVNTITEADGTLAGYNVFPSGLVSTDGDGEITAWLFIARDLPLADALTETNILMTTFSGGGDSASPAAECTTVNMVPACNIYTAPAGDSAMTTIPGSWLRVVVEEPRAREPIPGLTGYGLALTTLGLLLLGSRRLRRRS